MVKAKLPAPEQAKKEEVEALIGRVRQGELRAEDRVLVERLLRLLLELVRVIEAKNVTISRLKRWLFGPGSDRRSGAGEPEPGAGTEVGDEARPVAGAGKPKAKVRGHGRLPAGAYLGAQRVECRHRELAAGSRCPGSGCGGKLHRLSEGAVFVRLVGQPLVGATRYDQEVLRCGNCQTRYVAPLPAGVAAEKYDTTADAAMVLAKYGAGLPFHRLARMQAGFGIPLPEAVQWERAEALAQVALPVFLELEREAARASVLYQDDTGVRILKPEVKDGRTSQQTTGLVAEVGDHRVALYRSGADHAGENASRLLKERPVGLDPLIRMGDALAANRSPQVENVVEAVCLAHARRQFVDIEAFFPQECAVVLDALDQVYEFDRRTKKMTPAGRLAFHQEHSEPVLKALEKWIAQQFSTGQVEPNGSLGKALSYLQRHWEELTQWVRVAGAPIDNNPCERALKRPILQRKNAYFYRTSHGAAIGDLWASVLETCRLNGIPEFAYLVALGRAGRAVRAAPRDWLPWVWAARQRAAAA